MRILYYSWNENTKDICISEMRKLGYEVTEFVSGFKKYDFDEEEIKALKKAVLEGNGFDCIFSFNYFPDVSRCALELSIPYISWVYDSPHLTLQSKTLGNATNTVYLFDHVMYEKFRARGYSNVRYMPLPSRIIPREGSPEYRHDITFLGSLYSGNQDQYGSINSFPEYLKGYLDSLICTEKKVYGMDIIDEVLSGAMLSEVKKYVNAELGDNYNKCGDEIFKDMMRRRVTMEERTEALSLLGSRFKIDLYSGSKCDDLPVRYLGYADYSKEMPEIFYTSKINLNISLRSIRSGVPLRVMDILGAGGFCLTNYQEEIAEYFDNGRDLVWYESLDDMAEKAEYYLAHDDERMEIARRGQEKAEALFSYGTQLKKIFDSFT